MNLTELKWVHIVVVIVSLPLKSCCFEGCGDCTSFPTGPSSERPTSRWCCHPRQTGTFFCICCWSQYQSATKLLWFQLSFSSFISVYMHFPKVQVNQAISLHQDKFSWLNGTERLLNHFLITERTKLIGLNKIMLNIHVAGAWCWGSLFTGKQHFS